jgi:hypothetical protein
MPGYVHLWPWLWGGSYESLCDTPSRLLALVCCYHLEVVRCLVDAVHHRAVDVYYLSKTSIGVALATAITSLHMVSFWLGFTKETLDSIALVFWLIKWQLAFCSCSPLAACAARKMVML